MRDLPQAELAARAEVVQRAVAVAETGRCSEAVMKHRSPGRRAVTIFGERSAGASVDSEGACCVNDAEITSRTAASARGPVPARRRIGVAPSPAARADRRSVDRIAFFLLLDADEREIVVGEQQHDEGQARPAPGHGAERPLSTARQRRLAP